jgi:hypothetical protein
MSVFFTLRAVLFTDLQADGLKSLAIHVGNIHMNRRYFSCLNALAIQRDGENAYNMEEI